MTTLLANGLDMGPESRAEGLTVAEAKIDAVVADLTDGMQAAAWRRATLKIWWHEHETDNEDQSRRTAGTQPGHGS